MANIMARSGHATDIQEACNAANPGDNVSIPAGDHNFIEDGESWILVNVPVGVNLFGAGMVDPNIYFDETKQLNNWRTILRIPYEYPTGIGDSPGDNNIIFFRVENPNKYTDRNNRFSGFALKGYRDELLDQGVDNWTYPFPSFIGIQIRGVRDYRVDHVLMRNLGEGAVQSFNDYSPECIGRGVVDHSKFINTAGMGIIYGSRTCGYGVYPRLRRDVGLSYWEPDISKVIGSYGRGTMFIEDCYLQRWRHCISSIACAHWVFRHNRINLDEAYGSLDAHGTYDNTGTRAWEIYDNIIENADPRDPRECMRLRGGGGVIFNNTMRNYRFGINFDKEGGVPECWIHDVWLWNNIFENIWGGEFAPDPFIENVDYYLRPPNLAQDGFEYTPYPYPHPLVSGIPMHTLTVNSLPSGVPFNIRRV